MDTCKCRKETVRVYKGTPCCISCYSESRMAQYLAKRGVPPRYFNSKLNDFDFKVPLKSSLYITGSIGCGKTHLMAALLRNDVTESLNKPVPCSALFVNMLDLLSSIRNSYSDSSTQESQIIDLYRKVENLYIDDIGIDKVNDWKSTIIYQIIDHRYTNDLRTVVSSNLSLDGLNDILGERITSRIAGMCELIQMKGTDRRLL